MINQSTKKWRLLLNFFVKRTILVRAIAPRHCRKPPSACRNKLLKVAALLVVVDDINGEQWCPSTKKLHTGNVAAGVCSFAKVAERETCRSCSNPPPPTADRWWLLVGEAHLEHDGPAHGTRGATDSSEERRVGHIVNSGFNSELFNAPLPTLRTWRSAIGSTTTESRRWRGLIRWYVLWRFIGYHVSADLAGSLIGSL